MMLFFFSLFWWEKFPLKVLEIIFKLRRISTLTENRPIIKLKVIKINEPSLCALKSHSFNLKNTKNTQKNRTRKFVRSLTKRIKIPLKRNAIILRERVEWKIFKFFSYLKVSHAHLLRKQIHSLSLHSPICVWSLLQLYQCVIVIYQLKKTLKTSEKERQMTSSRYSIKGTHVLLMRSD